MANLIVIKRADGGITVTHAKDAETNERIFATWQEHASAEWLPATWEVVPQESVPNNRLYRNAFTHVGGYGYDMAKAKEIAHGRRRNNREQVIATDRELVQKAAAGIPLKAGQKAADAHARMNAYMADVDDVAQIDIDNAVDVTALEAIERANGFI